MKINIKKKIKILTVVILNILITIGVVFFIKSDVERNEHRNTTTYFNTLNNVRINVESMINTNLRIIDLISFSNEMSLFMGNNEINYYNATKLAQLVKEYSIFSETEILVCRPELDVYVGAGTLLHKADMVKKYGTLPFSEEDLKKRSKGCYSARTMTDQLNDNYIVLLNKNITIDGKDINFIMSISRKAMEKYFLGGNDVVYLVENGKIIVGNKNTKRSAFGDKNAISLNSENISDWNYYYVPNSSNIVWVYFRGIGLLLLLLAGGYYIGCKLSNLIYMPIKKVTELISDEDVVTDELQYIENKMKIIRSQQNKMQKEITEYFNRFEQQFLINLLHGIANSRDVNEYISRTQVNGDFMYTVVLLECLENDEEKYTREISKIYENIAFGNFGKTVLMPDRRIAVIASCTENLLNIFTTLLLDIELKFGIRYIGVVSDGATDKFEDLARLYAECDRMLKRKALFGNNIMLKATNMENDEYYYPVDMEKIILDHIKSNQYDDAMLMIDSLLKRNLIDSHLSEQSLKDFKLAIISTIKRVMIMVGKKEEELFGEDFVLYLELGSIHSPENFAEKINSIIKTILKAAQTGDESGNYLVENIIKYVHENYGDPDKVCLAGTAEHFNVSTSYISRLFKKNNGATYKGFVTSYRFECAKNMMRDNPGIRIKDIAQRVGYSNVNSFIRAFEKAEGITPDVYKRRI